MPIYDSASQNGWNRHFSGKCNFTKTLHNLNVHFPLPLLTVIRQVLPVICLNAVLVFTTTFTLSDEPLYKDVMVSGVSPSHVDLIK